MGIRAFCQSGLAKHIHFFALLLDLIEFFPETDVMSVSLDHLEDKVDQILAVCASLRDENQTLRAHVASLEVEKHALSRKIEVTRERLEALMTRLPEE